MNDISKLYNLIKANVLCYLNHIFRCKIDDMSKASKRDSQAKTKYKANLELMKSKDISCDCCLSGCLETCVWATSGIQWNHDSLNKNCDWNHIAAAITVKSTLI